MVKPTFTTNFITTGYGETWFKPGLTKPNVDKVLSIAQWSS